MKNLIIISLIPGMVYGGNFLDHQQGGNISYLDHRYLNNLTGRFLTQDPKKQYSSHYNYGSGNVINHSDPTGLITEAETAAYFAILRSTSTSAKELEKEALSAAENITRQRTLAGSQKLSDINETIKAIHELAPNESELASTSNPRYGEPAEYGFRNRRSIQDEMKGEGDYSRLLSSALETSSYSDEMSDEQIHRHVNQGYESEDYIPKKGTITHKESFRIEDRYSPDRTRSRSLDNIEGNPSEALDNYDFRARERSASDTIMHEGSGVAAFHPHAFHPTQAGPFIAPVKRFWNHAAFHYGIGFTIGVAVPGTIAGIVIGVTEND